MKITVDIPDSADPKTIDALEKAITQAGGTWSEGDDNPAEDMDEMAPEPGEMEPGMPPGMPPMPPGMPPGMPGMPPGGAGAMMRQKGAQALRPPFLR